MSTIACEVSHDSPQVCLAPWRENPNRLVSLWDILKVFEPRDVLTRIRALNNVASLLSDTSLSSNTRLNLIEQLRSEIDLCHSTCTALELPVSAIRLAQLGQAVETIGAWSGESVADAASNIHREIPILIENELSTHSFLAVSPSRKEYLDEPRKGWEEIIDRFTDSVVDVEEMRKCFALSRYAACVFHSVHVIEHGLIAIGSWLPSLNDPKAGWPSVTQELERIMNTKYPQRTPFEQTHSNFIEQVNALMKAIKFAWRNKISHAGSKLHVLSPDFAPEIAEEIMIAIRGFMRTLAVELP